MKNQDSTNLTNAEAFEYLRDLDRLDALTNKNSIGDKDNLSQISDTEITARFRDAAIERGRCGFNAVAANRILDDKMAPAYKELVTRGETALRALLQLTQDENPHVRLAA